MTSENGNIEATPATAAEAEAPQWVNGVEAQRMFGVSQWMWDRWNKQGLITCGQALGESGRYKRYPVEQLRAEIERLRQPQVFPPPGMVEAEQARKMFGISTWMWSKWTKEGKLGCGRWVINPGVGRTKVFPIEELGRVIEKLRDTGPFPPPGWVGRKEAARLFDVSPITWKGWVVQGKVPRGRWFMKPGGGRCYLWAAEDLQRLLEKMRGPDKAYWDPKNPGYYHVPPGYVGRKQAWRMFGVDKATWKRWEREKHITCGKRVHRGGPKLYKVDDLERLLAEFGKYSPPYPDPERPGVYRVPLAGHDVRRVEAIIDAESLPLVAGNRWYWSAPSEDGGLGQVALSKQGLNTPLHRIIMGVTDPDLRVMHRNDDPLDCRRENLVVRTRSEMNGASRKPRTYHGRPCTSRFKGVCWCEHKGKWVAQIRAEGMHRLLGRFNDEISAAQAYDEAAVKAWGEHARVNFPDTAAADAAALQGETPQPREAA